MSIESARQAYLDTIKPTIAEAHVDWAIHPGSAEYLSRRLSEDGTARVVDAAEVERIFGPEAARAWLRLREAKAGFLATALAADPKAAEADLLDRIGRAIAGEDRGFREGPYGFFDYSRHEVEEPYRVRDFRDRQSPDYGATVFQSNDRAEAKEAYDRFTRRHAAEAVLATLRGETAAPAPVPSSIIPGAQA